MLFIDSLFAYCVSQDPSSESGYVLLISNVGKLGAKQILDYFKSFGRVASVSEVQRPQNICYVTFDDHGVAETVYKYGLMTKHNMGRKGAFFRCFKRDDEQV